MTRSLQYLGCLSCSPSHSRPKWLSVQQPHYKVGWFWPAGRHESWLESILRPEKTASLHDLVGWLLPVCWWMFACLAECGYRVASIVTSLPLVRGTSCSLTVGCLPPKPKQNWKQNNKKRFPVSKRQNWLLSVCLCKICSLTGHLNTVFSGCSSHNYTLTTQKKLYWPLNNEMLPLASDHVYEKVTDSWGLCLVHGFSFSYPFSWVVKVF